MASDTPTILPRIPGEIARYSSTVRIQLKVGGHTFFPTHTSAGFLIFREPQTLAQSMARLVISVDGELHESAIEILPYFSPAVRIPIRLIAEPKCG